MQPALKDNAPKDRASQIAEEYRDFAYIVSHDLNAPLRHVKEFVGLLIGGRKNQLTEEEQEYVHFLEKSLQKLDDMQNSLLTFSRLNTRAGPLKETDCNIGVANALRELNDVVNEHLTTIKCGDLPTIMADPKQIHLLFVNLISNALKFHDDDKTRKVSISATDQEEVWLFKVQDNGIGIDGKHHEEVFRMFKRLKPDKYSGIGAGLTIAHKIVQRHGGEIIIESDLNQGTCVYFSLPKL